MIAAIRSGLLIRASLLHADPVWNRYQRATRPRPPPDLVGRWSPCQRQPAKLKAQCDKYFSQLAVRIWLEPLSRLASCPDTFRSADISKPSRSTFLAWEAEGEPCRPDINTARLDLQSFFVSFKRSVLPGMPGLLMSIASPGWQRAKAGPGGLKRASYSPSAGPGSEVAPAHPMPSCSGTRRLRLRMTCWLCLAMALTPQAMADHAELAR